MHEYIISTLRDNHKTYLQYVADGFIITVTNISMALTHKTAEDAELRKVWLQVKFPDYLYGVEVIENM